MTGPLFECSSSENSNAHGHVLHSNHWKLMRSNGANSTSSLQDLLPRDRNRPVSHLRSVFSCTALSCDLSSCKQRLLHICFRCRSSSPTWHSAYAIIHKRQQRYQRHTCNQLQGCSDQEGVLIPKVLNQQPAPAKHSKVCQQPRCSDVSL